jgi:hypothetical protein
MPIIKLFEELKLRGLEEAEYIENDKAIDLSKMQKKRFIFRRSRQIRYKRNQLYNWR